MADGLLSSKDFAARIRAKYPGAYDHVSDDELTQRVIKKYPSYGGQVQLAPPGLPDVTPKELRRGQTMTPSGPMPYGQAVAAGPNQLAGQAEAAMGFGRPMSDIAKTSAQSAAQAANVAAPIFTGGMSIPLQSAIQAGTGGLETATEGGSLKDIGKSAAIGAAIPPVAEGLAAGGKAALKAVRGPVNANISEALHIPEGSKLMQKTIKESDMANPYLGGQKPDLATVQERLGSGKKEIFKPIEDALEIQKDRVIKAPDGIDMKVKDLQDLRNKLSAQRSKITAGLSPEKLTELRLAGTGKLPDLDAQLEHIDGTLDPVIKETGIDPAAIRKQYGSLKGVERRIGGMNTIAEKNQPYGLSKLIPRQYPGKLGMSLGWRPIEGVQDILSGKPLISGKPTDVAMGQLFREAGPKPDLGTPIRPVSGGSQFALEPIERRQYVRPIMTGEPGEPPRPQPAPEPAPYERRTPEQTRADIANNGDPAMADLDRQQRGRINELGERYPTGNYPTTLQPYGEGLVPPDETTPTSFYDRYGRIKR